MRLTLRQAAMLAVSLISIVYLVYRGLYTLNLTTPYAVFASTFLYVGELYGIINMLLYFMQVWEVYEPPQKPILQGRTVDIFVPTYNEDPELLRATLRACSQLDYPHRTYLCDDGGTEARCKDPEKGPPSIARANELKAICAELGAIYMTRPANQHAKAGNLNHAFEQTDGEFIIIFDADHVPEPHFITRLIGYFEDERLGFVQTPHAFYNFDSFQARLNHKKSKYWEEGQLFYHVIQPGRNYWNCPIFAGSAAMFRRKALEDVGYIALETITEDMHTGLRMNSKGWKSLGVSERLICGVAAADVTTFHSQRLRWGEGNLSVIFTDNPLTMPGLTLGQRLCYFATMINWAGGIFKLAIYMTPLLMLFTGVPPVNRFSWTLGGFMTIYMLGCILGTKVAGQGYGSFWYSELFTMAGFWTQVRATSRAIFWRKFQAFIVTSKRGRQDKSIWPYVRPQCYLIAFSGMALVWAWSRPLLGLTDDIFKPMLATAWALFHMLLAYLVVRRACWIEDRRYSTRHIVHLPVGYETQSGARGLGTTVDLNERGVGFIAYEPIEVGETLKFTLRGVEETITIEGVIRHRRGASDAYGAGFRYGVQFQNLDVHDVDALFRACVHYAVPYLYQKYAIGHQKSYAMTIAYWLARHFGRRRHQERHDYRLPVILHPDDPHNEYPTVTENVSRTAFAVMADKPARIGSQVRFDMATPLGSLHGNARVLRDDHRIIAAKEYHQLVLDVSHLDGQGRTTYSDMLAPTGRKRWGEILEPNKKPMPVPMNKPLAMGTMAILLLCTVEFGVFRIMHRDDFFLRAMAHQVEPASSEQIDRVLKLHRETMGDKYPSTDRLVLLGEALTRVERPVELAEVMKRLAPRDRDNLDLQLALARAFDEGEEFEQAEGEYQRLLASIDRGQFPASRREEVLAFAARSAARSGDIDLASQRFTVLINLNPNKPEYRHELASVLMSARHFSDAARLYDGVDIDYDGRVMLVLIYSAARDWPAAEREAKALTRAFPDDSAAEGMLADVLQASGEYLRARVIYERLVSSGASNLKLVVQLAHSSLWARNYDQAMQEFQAIIDRHLNNPELTTKYPHVFRGFVNAAAMAKNLGEPQKKTALALYERTLKEPGSDAVYLARLGWVLHRLGEYDKSAALLDQAVAIDPTDQALRRQLAGALVAAGRSNEAIRMLEGFTTNLEARTLVADAHAAAGNFDAAIMELREILKESPTDAATRSRLADVLSWKGEFKESLELLSALAREETNNPRYPVRLAEVTLWSKDYAGALKRYEVLLAAHVPKPELWWNFVDAAAGAGRLTAEQAKLAGRIADRTIAGEHMAPAVVAEFRKANREPPEATYLTRLAWVVLENLRDKPGATSLLNRALELQPAGPSERKELAGVLAAAGRFKEAIKLYEGLTLDLEDRLTLARFEIGVEDYAAAERDLKVVLERRPLDKLARLLFADLSSARGEFAEALALLNRLLAEYPMDVDLKIRRADTTLWAQQPAKALEHYTELLREDPLLIAAWPGFLDAASRATLLSEEQKRQASQIADRIIVSETRDAELQVRAALVLHRHLNNHEGAKSLVVQAMLVRPKDPAILIRMGWVLHQMGETPDAVRVLTEALALRPEKASLRKDLAGALAAVGKFKESEAILDELAKASPEDAELQLRLVDTALGTGNFNGALNRLDKLLTTDPMNPLYRRAFIDAAAGAKTLSPAQIEQVRKLSALPPPDGKEDAKAMYFARLGWIFHREGERTKDAALNELAKSMLDKALAVKVTDSTVRQEVANMLLAVGRPKDALPLLEELSKANPNDLTLQKKIAETALWSGDLAIAIERLHKILEANFEEPALWVQYVDAAAGMKKGAMAEPQVRLVQRIAGQPVPEAAPKKALYLARLAWTLHREDKPQEAARILDQAIAITPDDAKVREEVVGVLIAAGRFKEAREWLEELAKANPNDAALNGRLAEVALWSGSAAQALEVATRVLERDFELSRFWSVFLDAAAPLNKGQLNEKQMALAVRIGERPVPDSVTDKQVYLSRIGWILHREGKVKEAAPLLEQAAAKVPTDPKSRRELGGILTAAGKYDEALKMFEGLQLTPEDRLQLVALHASAKQFEKAEQQCREYLREKPNDPVVRRWLADLALWGARYSQALTLYQELLAEDDDPDLWPGFIEAAVKADSLDDKQTKYALGIAETPGAEDSKDVAFLARMAVLLYRSTGGKDVVATPMRGAVFGPAVVVIVRSQSPRHERIRVLLARAIAERPRDPLILARLAWAVYQAGDTVQASRLIDESIALKPQEPAVRREVGDVLVAIGRYDVAVPWFEDLAGKSPDDLELQARLGEVTVWAGKFELGLARLEGVFKIEFNRPNQWRPYVDGSSSAAKMTEDQVKFLLRIADQPSPIPESERGARVLYLSRMAWALWREGDRTLHAEWVTRANQLLSDALAMKPDTPKVLFELAGTLTAARRFDEAYALYELLEKQSPNDRTVRAQLAKLALWGNRPQKALDILTSMLEADIAQPEIWRWYAEAATQSKLSALQVALLEKIAEQPVEKTAEPSLTLLWTAKAMMAHAKATNSIELTKKAEGVFDRVAAMPVRTPDERKVLAGELAGQGRSKQALELVRGLDLRDAAGRALMTDLYAADKDFVAAQREARELLKLKNDRESRIKLAEVLAWGGEYVEAAEMLQKLEAEDYRDRRVALRTAQVALWGRDYDAALVRFARLLGPGKDEAEIRQGFVDSASSAKDIKSPVIRKAIVQIAEQTMNQPIKDPVYIGRLAWILTRFEEHEWSAKLLMKAFENDKSSREIRFRLAQALTAAGRFDEAAPHYEYLRRTAPKN